MGKATGIVVAALLIMLAGGGGFYGGMQYQKAQLPSFAQGGFPGGGMPDGAQGTSQGQGANGQRQGGGPVSGEIVSKDESSITVKLTDGSTKIVMLSSKASVGKFTTVKLSDLKKGEQVTALGTTNSDGSVTATMVQIGQPAGMFGGRAPGGNSNNGNAGGNATADPSGNAQ